MGRKHYLVVLRPGLASSAFAFGWSFGLAWPPTGLCEEPSLEMGTAGKKTRMRGGGDKSPRFSTSHAVSTRPLHLGSWISRNGDQGLRMLEGRGSPGVGHCEL